MDRARDHELVAQGGPTLRQSQVDRYPHADDRPSVAIRALDVACLHDIEGDAGGFRPQDGLGGPSVEQHLQRLAEHPDGDDRLLDMVARIEKIGRSAGFEGAAANATTARRTASVTRPTPTRAHGTRIKQSPYPAPLLQAPHFVGDVRACRTDGAHGPCRTGTGAVSAHCNVRSRQCEARRQDSRNSSSVRDTRVGPPGDAVSKPERSIHADFGPDWSSGVSSARS